jgi:hypothetical protein
MKRAVSRRRSGRGLERGRRPTSLRVPQKDVEPPPRGESRERGRGKGYDTDRGMGGRQRPRAAIYGRRWPATSMEWTVSRRQHAHPSSLVVVGTPMRRPDDLPGTSEGQGQWPRLTRTHAQRRTPTRRWIQIDARAHARARTATRLPEPLPPSPRPPRRAGRY